MEYYLNKKTAKPFLKWAGGKSQVIREITQYYPFKIPGITKYAEPFVGGGAVLFDILNLYDIKEVYISDINTPLINTYKVIRDNATELIDKLKNYEREYLSLNKEERTEYFSEKRDVFNTLKNECLTSNSIENAALMIFLNRTCFNGLYRVNKQGLFNVPIGSYENPLICDESNLLNVSEKLKNVIIACADYKDSENFIDSNTFVYIDPPYRPLTETASFTAYNEIVFTDKEQIELSQFVERINRKGAKILISNSDPKNTDPQDCFFDNLYSNYYINRIQANRMINSSGEERGKINELLISNYEREEIMKYRDFNVWLASLKNSISDYGYYTDFEKIYENIDSIKVELNILNSLIGSKNIENDFESLINKYPETLRCIPLLLAVRANELCAMDSDGSFVYNFKVPNLSAEHYKIFMRKTGLFDLISNHIVNNLVDYATGVETGLDSNARKNRGGHLMENLVESFIVKAGFVKGENYFKEVYINQISDMWDIDLSAVSNDGKTEKRFDFVVKTHNKVYLIETNFYSSSGSKLNETARSYKTLALETQTLDNVIFVWFTDGKGWLNARHNLEETFDVMKHIYNIKDLENGIIEELFK